MEKIIGKRAFREKLTDRYFWFQFALFIAAFVLRILFVIRMGNQPEDISDGARFFEHAQNLLAGKPALVIGPRPLQDLFIFVNLWLFKGNAVFATRIFEALIGSLVPILIFKLSRKIFNEYISIIAGITATLYLGYVYFSGHITAENNMIVLVLVTTLYLYKIDYSRVTVKNQILVGLLVALLACLRAEGFVFGALILLYIFWLLKANKLKITLKILALSLSFILLVLSPFLLTKQKLLLIDLYQHGYNNQANYTIPAIYNSYEGKNTAKILNVPKNLWRKKIEDFKYIFTLERPRLHENDISFNGGMSGYDYWKIGKLKLPVFQGGEMLFIPYPFYLLAIIGFLYSIKSWKKLILIYFPVIILTAAQLVFHVKGTQIRQIFMHTILILSAAGLYYLIQICYGLYKQAHKFIINPQRELEIRLTLKRRNVYVVLLAIALFVIYYIMNKNCFRIDDLYVTQISNENGRNLVRVQGIMNKPLKEFGMRNLNGADFFKIKNGPLEYSNCYFSSERNTSDKYSFDMVYESTGTALSRKDLAAFFIDRKNETKTISYNYFEINPNLFWDFNTANFTDGWNAAWMLHLEGVKNGYLYCKSIGLRVPTLERKLSIPLDTQQSKIMVLKMKHTQGTRLNFHWWTYDPVPQYNYKEFAVIPDNKFHVYYFDLSQEPNWRGLLNSIEFDPIGRNLGELYIDYIGFIDTEKKEENYRIKDISVTQIKNGTGKDLLRIQGKISLRSGGSREIPDQYNLDVLCNTANTVFWDFDKKGETEGWQASWMLQLIGVEDGLLHCRSVGIRVPTLEKQLDYPINAQKYRTLVLKMKNNKGTVLTCHWWTNDPNPEYGFQEFTIIPDNQFHIYYLNLGDNPKWKGIIKNIRLDPIGREIGDLYIDYIGFIENI